MICERCGLETGETVMWSGKHDNEIDCISALKLALVTTKAQLQDITFVRGTLLGLISDLRTENAKLLRVKEAASSRAAARSAS